MMATFHQLENDYFVAVKGAPERILGACSTILTDDGKKELDEQRKRQLNEINDKMAEHGLRIISPGNEKRIGPIDVKPYQKLTFLRSCRVDRSTA